MRGTRSVQSVVRRIVLLALPLFFLSVAAADELPYLGHWSNGRGETLVLTKKTLRFADNKAVSYRDVTRATDGEDFELLITASGEVNAFPGKTLSIHCEGDSMEMTSYSSHADFMQDANPQSKVTWFKDEK